MMTAIQKLNFLKENYILIIKYIKQPKLYIDILKFKCYNETNLFIRTIRGSKMRRALRRFVSSLTGTRKFVFFTVLILVCIVALCLGIYTQFFYKYSDTDPLMLGINIEELSIYS